LLETACASANAAFACTMSIGDDAGGAAEAIAQMNISKANVVVATSLLKYDMFPHGWLPDSAADFSKVPHVLCRENTLHSPYHKNRRLLVPRPQRIRVPAGAAERETDPI
jgi:hypothetical protein